MKDICVFFGTGFEELEALSPVDILRRAGLPVKMVSIYEPENGKKTVTGSHGIEIGMDACLSEIDFDRVEMIVLPGGMPGTRNLEACAPLMEQVKAFAEAGRPLAAICAAPTVFGHLGLLTGKTAGCYPGMEGDLTGACVSYDPVSVDGNIITARGAGAAIPFALAILAFFEDEKRAAEMAEKIVFEK